jgi:hypothetical protein
MNSLIDELLGMVDELDDGSQAMRLWKSTTLASLGAGEIGDRWPITEKDTQEWMALRQQYRTAVERGHTELADSLGILLTGKTFELINRCFTSQSSTVLFEKVRQRWKK